MTEPDARRARTALELLRKREPFATDAGLDGGRVVRVHNVAWGRDLGDDHDHVTTNVSPGAHEHAVDFFDTSEIVALVDPDTGAVIYEARARKER